MTQYLIDPNGKFVRLIEGTASEIFPQIPPGHDAVSLPPPRLNDYWNGTNWVAIGAPPKPFLNFDYVTKAWVDDRDIEVVRKSKWEQIKRERNSLEFEGFKFEDKHYDSNQISQGRILAAFVFGEPVTWTTSDDEVVDLTVEQVRGLGIAMSTHVQSVHERGRLARLAIAESEDIESIEAVML